MKGKIAKLMIAALTATSVLGGYSVSAEAKDGGELVVYSPAPEEILDSVIQEFQDTTGIEVELIQAGSGELLTRIKSESNSPMADVIYGCGAEAAEAYKEFFTPYKSPEAENIKEEYRSEDGSWTGAYVSPTVIMYNKNLVAEEDVPKGWAGVVDEKWKGQIAFADPAISGSSFTTMAILVSAMGGEEKGWDFIRDYVKTLDGNILNSSGAPVKGVADGEYAMCITQEQAALEYISAGSENVGIIYPEEGTAAIPSSVSVIKGAPNEENAQKFVDFVLGSDVQKKLSEFRHHTVRTDVEESGDFKDLSEIKMVDFDFLGVSEEKDNYIQQWNDIVIGK